MESNHKDSNNKLALISLASIPLVMTLGNSMLIPVLPSIEKQLHISAFQVSMIITVYSIVAILLIPAVWSPDGPHGKWIIRTTLYFWEDCCRGLGLLVQHLLFFPL
jgi:hypothetical protein